jgi:peptidyl-prolyl cis-trans isomerase A (cyclophilin A)
MIKYLVLFCLLCIAYCVEEKDFKVKFQVSQLDSVHGVDSSEFTVLVHPSWAPHGAARFKELIKSGYYVNNRFFRVVIAYIAEFGVHGDPSMTAYWQNNTIPDDPVVVKNQRKHMSFTCDGPNSRSTAVFINYSQNKDMDKRGCAPFGEIIDGMATVDSVFPVGSHGKGDGWDTLGPNRQMTIEGGNEYLNRVFPKLSYISSAEIIEEHDEKKENVEVGNEL